MKRLESIDVLRALAILLMVQLHFVEYLTAPSGEPGWLRTLAQGLGALALPLFTFLAGMSLALSLHKQAADGRPARAIARRTVNRGVVLFVLGLAFLTAVWGPKAVFAWDVLNLLGVAILVLYPLRRLPAGLLLLMAVAVLLISPGLRQWVVPAGYGEVAGAAGHAPFEPAHVLRDACISGFFPVFPWLAFPLYGFAVAEMVVLARRPAALRWSPAVGVGLLCLGLGGGLVGNAKSPGQWPGETAGWPLTALSFYPPSTSYLVAVAGLILLAFWLLHVRLDLRATPRWWMVHFRRSSRFSLTIYVLHHAVLIWPILIVGTLTRGEPWAYFANALSVPLALGLAVAFLALLGAALPGWDRAGGRYGLEWVVARFTG